MNPLWKKIIMIFGLISILSYALLSNLIFFWPKYLESLLFSGFSAGAIIVIIIGTIQYTIGLKQDNSDNGLLNNWVYLQEERKRQRKLTPILYLFVVLGVGIFIWFGKYALETAILMSRDLPYVLNKNYPKIQGYVKSNEFTYQRGMRHVQYIKAIDTINNEYISINFEHQYKNIKEFSNYIIWYLPNTKLGVRVEEMN